MENVKLQDIDFIVPVRIDNTERLNNLLIQRSFFTNTSINCNFIYVEHDTNKKFNESHFIQSNSEFNKCLCYNTGLKLSTRKYACCIDSDILINPVFLLIAINRGDLCVAYNKTCIYLNFDAKRYISEQPTLKTLYRIISREHLNGNDINVTKDSKSFTVSEFYMTPPNQCIGGCLVGKRNTFLDIGGFNTAFEGWGYEDNEILVRANKLGKDVVFINDTNALLYHLPHEHSIIAVKQGNNKNKQEMDRIDTISGEELQQYVNSWK